MLSWVRARIANQLAYSGVSWAEIFAEYHSGTYVNQWMVLDLRKFKPGQDPLPKFLTVLEEVPGYIRFEDMTPILKVWPFLFLSSLLGDANFLAVYVSLFDHVSTYRINLIGPVITILILTISLG
jgi:hypothetical protein